MRANVPADQHDDGRQPMWSFPDMYFHIVTKEIREIRVSLQDEKSLAAFDAVRPDVSLILRQWLLERAPKNGEHSTTHVGEPKTWERRTVPIPTFLVPQIREAMKGKGDDDLLFTGPDGGYLPRAKKQVGWFRIALEKASINPEMTPHDMRHTAASLAVQSGAHVKAVQRMLGHASAAMTLDIYADLFDSDLDMVAEALSAARARAVS